MTPAARRDVSSSESAPTRATPGDRFSDGPLETSRAVHVSILAFACLFPTFGAWLYFVRFAGHDGMAAAYAVAKVLQFAIPVVWWLSLRRRRAEIASRSAPSILTRRPGVMPGLAFGAAVGGAMLLLWYAGLADSAAFRNVGGTIRAKIEAAGVTTPAAFLAVAVFYSLAHSGLEEWYWRGFVYRQGQRVLSDSTAIVGSSLAFTAHHILLLDSYIDSFVVVIGLSAGIAVGGAFWAWLYRRSGSLIGSWLGHLLVDVAIMTIGYDLLFG